MATVKVQSLNTSSVYNKERKLTYVIASATMTRRTHTSYDQAKNSFHVGVNTSYKPIFEEVAGPAWKKLESQFDKQELEKDVEVDIIVERLKFVVEKLVEIEISKFMGRVKAERLSKEDRLLVEEMRKEISGKYLEKAIGYLKSGCCKVSFEQKIKDVIILVNMLQESLLA